MNPDDDYIIPRWTLAEAVQLAAYHNLPVFWPWAVMVIGGNRLLVNCSTGVVDIEHALSLGQFYSAISVDTEVARRNEEYWSSQREQP